MKERVLIFANSSLPRRHHWRLPSLTINVSSSSISISISVSNLRQQGSEVQIKLDGFCIKGQVDSLKLGFPRAL
ncbi:hypothetical protein SLA2020_392590 [Shorea laevis]